uniref:DNA excision repair protein ERCC-6 n=1 Tax=Rhabditophanes sp. KR3021 TaxID=114890 RepID=A0AC35UGX8_9BILA
MSDSDSDESNIGRPQSVFNPNDIYDQDDFIIDDAPSSGLNNFVFNCNIAEHTVPTDLVDLDLGVKVYAANNLQENLLLKAKEAYGQTNRKRKINILEDDLDDDVKRGLKTPFEALKRKNKKKNNDDKEYEPDNEKMFDESDSDQDSVYDQPSSSKTYKKAFKDDGDDCAYFKRINNYISSMYADSDEEELAEKNRKFKDIGHELKIDKTIWRKLYNYQKTCLRWLSELHHQNVGAILSDDMGLGKTVQIVSFLRALSESKLIDPHFKYRGLGPTLIVCPATLMHNWFSEFVKWFPLCRVVIFHSIGSCKQTARELIKKITAPHNNGSIIITTYATFTQKHKYFKSFPWHYVILDEGHYIRNPDIKTTEYVKQVQTAHRIIVSGSPLQNNLKELFSLMDFIYPKRLGSLVSFMQNFSIPIVEGGYANATPLQVRTAYKCCCVLRDLISPFILRRMKKDVQSAIHLPSKNEQVLFCELTSEQRKLYEDYLNSKEMRRIKMGKMEIFKGLIMLRKLCNHADFITGGPNRNNEYDIEDDIEKDFGFYSRSSKMVCVQQLLKLWKQQGHKVLLFSQSRNVLSCLEKLIILEGYSYMRMDGGTAISKRQCLVEKFNTDANIFVFLLTTKVGGLGVNLTSANRIIIFDPDWNPCVDMQAQERAYRIGQKKDVTIYRLLTSGTIEEKMYQRQIFKQFLANNVLENSKQARVLKSHNIKELFVLGDKDVGRKHGTETACLFYGQANEKRGENFFDKRDKTLKRNKSEKEPLTEDEVKLSDFQKEELKKISKKFHSADTNNTDNEITSIDQISLITKKEVYKVKEEPAMTDNDYVLNALFKNKSVHSALCHNAITTDVPKDYQLVEEEANRVAKRAMDALSASRDYKQPSLTKREEPIRSGKDLIGRIKARKDRFLETNDIEVPDHVVNEEYSSHRDWPSNVRDQEEKRQKYSNLAGDIKMFFVFNGNKATSKEIVVNFRQKVDAEDSYIFRAILRKLSVFDEKKNVWKLKK